MPRRKKEPERRRGVVVVRDTTPGNGGTEDQKLLRSREPTPGFQETDTRRILRIMGEFVEGFDALADVGPAVAIFGSPASAVEIATTAPRGALRPRSPKRVSPSSPVVGRESWRRRTA